MGKALTDWNELAERCEKVISTRSGYAPTRSSGRYLTARVRVPAGTNWNYARGIEFDSAQDGRR